MNKENSTPVDAAGAPASSPAPNSALATALAYGPVVTYLSPKQVLYHITIATEPRWLVATTRGPIPYAQWVEEERQRMIKKNGWPVVVYLSPRSGLMSLVLLKSQTTD